MSYKSTELQGDLQDGKQNVTFLTSRMEWFFGISKKGNK